jgi:hypothetical protein
MVGRVGGRGGVAGRGGAGGARLACITPSFVVNR